MPMRGIHQAAMGVALASVLLAAGPAQAAIQVSPAILEGLLARGSTLGPVTVFNPGPEEVQARVELAWLTHDPLGRPIFLEDPDSRRAAQAVIRPSWQVATIGAGAARPLHFVVDPVDANLRAAYPVAFVQVPVPTGILRVAVLMLLGPADSGGGELAPTVRVRAAWVDQDAPGAPVGVLAEVFNAGEAHVRPRLVASVSGEGPGTLGEVALGPAVVLPGAVRRLQGLWRPAWLPVGRYRLQIGPADDRAAESGGGRSGLWYETAFEVVEPYRVAVVKGELQLSLTAASSVSPPRVQASVYNRGNTEVTPRLVVELARDGVVAASALATAPSVPPGGVATVELPWPQGVGAGRYVLTARWVDADRVVASGTVSVTSTAAVAARPEERERP